MVTVENAPAPLSVLPRARRTPLRLYLLGRSFVLMVTSMAGAALFAIWVTMVAVSPITIVAPLVLPVTAAVRWYADVHRRSASRALGEVIGRPYRPRGPGGPLRRVWQLERDPASWRDAWWCLVHAVVACVTATVSFALFVGGLFYLIYPLLYWWTPQRVFGRPFGGQVELHSVGQAALMMPLALVAFALWFGLAIPLARAEIGVTRALLGPPRR